MFFRKAEVHPTNRTSEASNSDVRISRPRWLFEDAAYYVAPTPCRTRPSYGPHATRRLAHVDKNLRGNGPDRVTEWTESQEVGRPEARSYYR